MLTSQQTGNNYSIDLELFHLSKGFSVKESNGIIGFISLIQFYNENYKTVERTIQKYLQQIRLLCSYYNYNKNSNCNLNFNYNFYCSKVFHICLGDGDVKWSFLCPNQTSFHQVGQVRLGQIRPDQARLGQIRLGKLVPYQGVQCVSFIYVHFEGFFVNIYQRSHFYIALITHF